MTENYVGIDYGMGVSNRDPENPELHYGAISQHTPASYIWDDFEGVYFYGCPECGSEFGEDLKMKLNENLNETCPVCEYESESDDDWYGEEAMYQEYRNKDEGYSISYSETLNCFFVEKGPFYTFAKYCSPCAPGSADLDSPTPNGIKGYCLGKDFFDDYNKCPYDIYSVETNELVFKAETDEDENS